MLSLPLPVSKNIPTGQVENIFIFISIVCLIIHVVSQRLRPRMLAKIISNLEFILVTFMQQMSYLSRYSYFMGSKEKPGMERLK
jgi:hypothetical protein